MRGGGRSGSSELQEGGARGRRDHGAGLCEMGRRGRVRDEPGVHAERVCDGVRVASLEATELGRVRLQRLGGRRRMFEERELHEPALRGGMRASVAMGSERAAGDGASGGAAPGGRSRAARREDARRRKFGDRRAFGARRASGPARGARRRGQGAVGRRGVVVGREDPGARSPARLGPVPSGALERRVSSRTREREDRWSGRSTRARELA